MAANSHGTTDAIFAAVYAVPGVLNAYVIDNPSGNTVDYGSTNYPLAPHSIYVAVIGGEAAAIAQAIWQFKDAGCSYNTADGEGSVETVTVYDTRYWQPPPGLPGKFHHPRSCVRLFRGDAHIRSKRSSRRYSELRSSRSSTGKMGIRPRASAH